MYELLTECFQPYKDSLKKQKHTNIEYLVATNPSFRPEIEEKNYPELEWVVKLMKKCWADDPSERPTFLVIKEILTKNKDYDGSAKIIKNEKK